jgi:hypothetical protein
MPPSPGCWPTVAGGRWAGGQRLLSERLFAELSRNQLADGVDGPAGYTGPGFGFGLGLAVRHDWGPAAMPCSAGELTWSGISGTALFVQPREPLARADVQRQHGIAHGGAAGLPPRGGPAVGVARARVSLPP